jgi:hypothetical protein
MMLVDNYRLLLPYAPERSIALPRPGFQEAQDSYHGRDSVLENLPYRTKYLGKLIQSLRESSTPKHNQNAN